MARKKKFVPMGVWAPDAPDIDTQALRQAKNLLPVFGSYRSAPVMEEITRKTIVPRDPINGAHVHLLAPRLAVQTEYPNETITNDFDIFGTDDEGLLITEAWEAVGADPPKDDSGLRIREAGESPGDADVRLGDFVDPGVDTGHKLLVRYNLRLPEHLTSFSLYAQLTDGGVDVTGGRITVTTGDDGYHTNELTMTEADVLAAALDYTDLGIDLHAEYVIGTTVEVIDPDDDLSSLGWIRDAGSDPGLTFSEILSEDAGYLRKDDEGVYLTSMLDVVEPKDLITPGTWTLKVGVGCELDTADVTVRLLSAEDEIMSDDTNVVSTTTLTNFDYDITPAMLQSINDWDQINVEVTLERTNATGYTQFRPEWDDQAEGTWVTTGAAGPWEAVSQVSPHDTGIYVENSDKDPEVQARVWFRFADITFAQPEEEINVHMEARAFGHCKWQVRLYDGDIPGNEPFATRNGTNTNESFSITMEDVNIEGKDETDIHALVRLVPIAEATNDRSLRVFQLYAESADDSTNEMRLFRIRIERPTTAGIEFVHTEFNIPALGVTGPGDQPFLYAGNNQSIFSVGDAGVGFVDKSNTSNESYGAASEAVVNWDFVSWGTWVIATNGSDPIQVQKGLGDRFEDLIPSPGGGDEWEEPLAKFVAVVKDFLFIGNISLPGDVTGSYNEYTAWWSRINEPDKFYKIDTTGQSDSQQFVTTPGEITALIGGEEATIYKRRSIYKMQYVGYPLYFNKILVADNEGTSYGNSVVKVGASQFYLGSNGFMHLPAQGPPVSISDNQISRIFTDTLYEDLALYDPDSDDVAEIQNAVTGAYDAHTGLVLWTYRRKDDPVAFENSVMLAFNPKEGRFSLIDGEPALRCSYVLASPAPLFTESIGFMRHFVMFRMDFNVRYWYDVVAGFDYKNSYEAQFEITPISSAFLAGESARGQNVSIHGMRPVFKKVGEEPIKEDMCIILKGSEDRWMNCRVTQSEELSIALDSNDEGWLMLNTHISGEYFSYSAKIHPERDQVVRELLGMEFDYEVGGA